MMKTMYKTMSNGISRKLCLLLLTICLIGVNETRASHATGGDLTYHSIGNGQYEVTFTFYRDCFGIDAPITQTLEVSSALCNFTIPGGVIMNQTGPVPPPVITHTCNGLPTTCDSPPGTEPGIQQYTYSCVVSLPSQCADWHFSTFVSARNAAITTLQNPDNGNLYVDAYLNNSTFENNSPQFLNDPVAFACIGQINNLNPGAVDADGDSLVFSFIAPRTSENSTVTYETGYSVSQPLVSSPPVYIDPVTGDIIMTPTQADVAAMAILVTEYRNGEIIGSVIRDMQLYIVPCTDSLPSASGIDTTLNFMASSCAGGNLCFNIVSNDPDPNDTLTMSWNAAIPGATFTVVGTPHPTGTFCWTPTPADARPQPYTFIVTVQDDACPSNGLRSYVYSIIVSGMAVTLVATDSLDCFGDSNGTAVVTATGGHNPITYSWTYPDQSTHSGPSISGLGGGTYIVDITDSIGCAGQETFTIYEPPLFVTSVTPTNSGCGGGLGSALATSTGGTGTPGYVWSTGSTVNPLTQLTSGTYTVTATDAKGCSATASAQVSAVSNTVFVIHATPASCLALDGHVWVTHTGGVGPFSYHWSNTADTTISDQNGVMAGNYTVLATDLGTGCTASLSAIVVNNAGINASITSQTDATCASSEDGSATVVANGGQPPYSYSWPNGDTIPTTNNLGVGTWTVIVTDYNGCLAVAIVTIGSVHPGPTVNLGIDTNACIGTPYMADAGPNPGGTYLWSDNSTMQTLMTSTAGNISVVVTDAFGCEATDDVNVNFVICFHGNGNEPTIQNPAALSIYPNPASGEVFVAITQLRETNVIVTMSDILGNSLFYSKEKSEYGYKKKFDIRSLPAGIYLMKVEYDGEIATRRIVKQ